MSWAIAARRIGVFLRPPATLNAVSSGAPVTHLVPACTATRSSVGHVLPCLARPKPLLPVDSAGGADSSRERGEVGNALAECGRLPVPALDARTSPVYAR